MQKEFEKKRYSDEMIFRYLEGIATEEEQNRIKKWLEESAGHKNHFEELKVYFNWFNKGSSISQNDREAAWSRIKAGYERAKSIPDQPGMKKPAGMFKIPVFFRIVAAMILTFLTGYYISSRIDRRPVYPSNLSYNEITAPLGARTHVVLPDGSKVWLNAGSKLKYPAFFAGESREVSLEGEAFFDVAKNENMTFIVNAADINIKVYGTKFNVKCYPDESLIQTTLVEGSLSVEPSGKLSHKKPVFLKPNQSITFYKPENRQSGLDTSNTSRKRSAVKPEQARMVLSPHVDHVPITSWKDKKWVIEGENLDDLAVKLERRYNVNITFRDESLKNYKFSGTLTNETFEQVLKIMQISAPLQFTVVNNLVTFSEDKTYRKKYDSMIETN